jgi:hypothetical protein
MPCPSGGRAPLGPSAWTGPSSSAGGTWSGCSGITWPTTTRPDLTAGSTSVIYMGAGRDEYVRGGTGEEDVPIYLYVEPGATRSNSDETRDHPGSSSST